MSKRFTIIDGYNLLHCSGILNRGTMQRVGRGVLEKARSRLFGILARQLELDVRKRTTIVFDSGETGLPNRLTVNDMLVEFANQYENADELIKILVRKHSVPKQLTVVSSDHEIQRAAIARGADAVDSDVWMDKIEAGLAKRPKDAPTEEVVDDRAEVDIDYWKKELGVDDLEFGMPNEDDSVDDDRRPDQSSNQPTSPGKQDDIFPPGYADDLWDDDQSRG